MMLERLAVDDIDDALKWPWDKKYVLTIDPRLEQAPFNLLPWNLPGAND
jgi:hypothetical protein